MAMRFSELLLRSYGTSSRIQCITSCTANSHRSGDGVCVLKACADRSWNASASFPCGSADCVYDAWNEEGHPCGTACTDPTNYRVSLTEGLCIERACTELSADEAACMARGGDGSKSRGMSACHYYAKKAVCEDMRTYQKRRSTVIVVACVLGSLGLVAVIVVVIVVIIVILKRRKPGVSTTSSSTITTSSSSLPSTHYSSNENHSPRVVGAYTFWELLGEGTFGEVFRCTKGKGSYAIKKFKSGKLMTEMEDNLANGTSAALNNRFLVRYIEKIVDSDDRVYVVMELCPKGDLRSLINEFKALEKKDAILNPLRIMKIFIQILLGLEVLHHNRIIHRDLKPENVFLDKDDNVKIGDFGCSIQLLSTSDKASTAIGTPLYVSPEVVSGKKYDARADMWSLGVLVYELCTFKWPFYDDNAYMVMELIRKGKYAPIPTMNCPREIRYIVQALLCFDVERRPTALSLLHHPFICNQGRNVGLSQYFPKRDLVAEYSADENDGDIAYSADSFLLLD